MNLNFIFIENLVDFIHAYILNKHLKDINFDTLKRIVVNRGEMLNF